jgi:hypothetical protein
MNSRSQWHASSCICHVFVPHCIILKVKALGSLQYLNIHIKHHEDCFVVWRDERWEQVYGAWWYHKLTFFLNKTKEAEISCGYVYEGTLKSIECDTWHNVTQLDNFSVLNYSKEIVERILQKLILTVVLSNFESHDTVTIKRVSAKGNAMCYVKRCIYLKLHSCCFH